MDEEKSKYLAILKYLKEPLTPTPRPQEASSAPMPERSHRKEAAQNQQIHDMTAQQLRNAIQVLLDVQSSGFDELIAYIENSTAPAPKPPRSDFDVYSETRRAELIAQNMGSTQGDIIKKLMKAYMKESAEAKQVFQAAAAQDRIRYEEEKQKYTEQQLEQQNDPSTSA